MYKMKMENANKKGRKYNIVSLWLLINGIKRLRHKGDRLVKYYILGEKNHLPAAWSIPLTAAKFLYV